MRDDLDDPRPLYVQVADGLRAAMDGGDFAVGDKLPSYAELAARYGISHMTVKQAIALLKADRRVVAKQGLGVFVRDTSGETPEGSELEMLRARVDQLELRVHAIEARPKRGGKP